MLHVYFDFFCYHDFSYDCMTDIGFLTSTLKQFLSLNILYIIHKKLQELWYRASMYTPFPSSDTETQSNSRICHITCTNISLYTIYSSRIRVYCAHLFAKLAYDKYRNNPYNIVV